MNMPHLTYGLQYHFLPIIQQKTAYPISFLDNYHAQFRQNNSPLINDGSSMTLQLYTMKFIDQICEKIVSPPKMCYSPYDLGSTCTPLGKRQDFQIRNNKCQKLQASYYQSNSQLPETICILYLHSMSGSRLESMAYAEDILKMGYDFCNFDFTGCGNSQGNIVSFGANQKYDVLAVVQVLKDKFNVNKVILWGRSMGSACAIKYCELTRNNNWAEYRRVIIGLILDSCFQSFSQLAVEIGHKHSDFPKFLIKAGYFILKNTLQQKGQFKVDDLELEPIISNLQIPILFLTSPDDVTVSCQHSEILFKKCHHRKKKLRYIKGLHNECRDADYLKEVTCFIEQIIREDKNNLFTSMVELKANRLKHILDESRKFILEADQNQRIQGGCYCSLFPPPLARSNSQDDLQTRRKCIEPPINRKKFKIQNKILSARIVQTPQNLTLSHRRA